jgi:Lar family restriction alleviation protein
MTQSDTDKLEPCPFCGGGLQEVGGLASDQFYTLCDCGAAGPIARTEAKAIAAWNRRTPDTKAAPLATDEVGRVVAEIRAMEKMREVLVLVSAAMLRDANGNELGRQWDGESLNAARPVIRAALTLSNEVLP